MIMNGPWRKALSNTALPEMLSLLWALAGAIVTRSTRPAIHAAGMMIIASATKP